MDFTLTRGTLVEDPDIFETKSDIGANVVLAEDHSYYDEDDEEWVHYDTSYFRCVAWGEMAEFLEDFEQGEHIEVTEGRITDDNWEDEDGVMHYNKKFKIEDFEQWIPPSERDDD